MEVINNLLNFKNMKIYQNTDWFSFSLDSVLLSNFVTINKSTKNIIDFCTGNAPIPLILSTKTKAKIIGVDIQKEICDLALKSVKINHLEDQISIKNLNINDLPEYYETDTFDVITCNPPYFKCSDNAILNNNKIKSIARHEIKMKINDIFVLARKLLKNNGQIAIVYRPERLLELVSLMKENNIEPKKN